jgi:hypothetical protein
MEPERLQSLVADARVHGPVSVLVRADGDVGQRSAADADDFMSDVASRLTSRVQLTTDAYKVYLNAVDFAFGVDVDYAVLEKHYGSFVNTGSAAHRYTPAKITGVKAATITGDPERKHVSTSYVERQNLTMRMHMNRFARLTNGFSKKIEMHAHNVALHFMYYNFCKTHQTPRVTPAMEAGLSDHAWSVDELVSLVPDSMPRQAQSAYCVHYQMPETTPTVKSTHRPA